MYPIVQGSKIETTDLYTHFKIRCFDPNYVTHTLLKNNSTLKEYSFNLPITIKSSNQERWKIDTHIYGLGFDDPTTTISANISTPRLLYIKLAKSDNTGIDLIYTGAPTESWKVNNGGTFYGFGMRQEQCLIDFSDNTYSTFFMEGGGPFIDQIGAQSQTGIGNKYSISTTGDFTKIYIKGCSVSNVTNTYINGLIIEFTRLYPYDLNNSVIL